MPEEIYIDRFLDSINTGQRKLLFDLFSFKVKNITLDYDQIMFDAETPVKEGFYLRTGIDYRSWKIDRWLALATRADAEGKKPFDEAAQVEKEIWEDPFVLSQCKPIRAMQLYSKIAYLNGVKQSVITTRGSELRDITFAGVKKHYYWIPEEDVHIRQDNSIPRDEFKGKEAGSVGSEAHFKDSITSTSSVLEYSNASVVLFPRSGERNQFTGQERVIELPDMSMFVSLLR